MKNLFFLPSISLMASVLARLECSSPLKTKLPPPPTPSCSFSVVHPILQASDALIQHITGQNNTLWRAVQHLHIEELMHNEINSGAHQEDLPEKYEGITG